MANCRTCKLASPALVCANEWTTNPDHIVCEDYERRETPPLVDVAKLLLEKMQNIGDGTLFNLDLLDARDILEKALARHQEDIDNAQD